MTLSLSEANLISAFTESVLFGLFTVLYASAIYILSKKWRKGVNILVSIVATVMYILGIIHLSVSLQRIINAFLKELNTPGGSDAYLGEVANKTYVFQVIVYQIQTLIGDAFIAYRLFIVWARDFRVVALAFLLWVGTLVTAIGGQIAINTVSPTSFTFAPSVVNWPVAFYSITLAQNIICTSLIAYRIWRSETQSSMIFKTKSLSPVLTIVIESGMIYSAFLIVLIGTYESESWSHYLILDALPQVIGFVFTMIIVRIGLGIAIKEISGQSLSTINTNAVHPISIHMSRFRHARDDRDDTIDLTSQGSIADSRSQKQTATIINKTESDTETMGNFVKESNSSGTLEV